ncbi:ABC transporter permease [Amycolatopsis sp. DSM 110486]|uniref:ABC transporter permease n=1 Tax=Amycolatopsis sp. DSM 110486 TaxID=2865832 RepID=UPI001C69BD28|nr:ABC transporter permease [Amycolatopsis sp. DSM 110486]QYN18804.1 ABC transporter permease [Amycolatopsis sp. DSM 110486]
MNVPSPKRTAAPVHRDPLQPATAIPELTSRRPRPLPDFLERNASLWTLGVLVLIIVGFAATTDNFLTKQGWQAISVSGTEILLLAVGETFVIVSGGIDLSIGAVLGFSGMVSAVVMRSLLGTGSGAGLVMVTGLVVSLTVGAVFGLVNGLVITRFKVTPFIVTLGALGVAEGATLLLNGGQDISDLPPRLSEIGNLLLADGWLAVPVAVAVAVTVVAWVFLAKTRYGRRAHAIGSNAQAAVRTGIDVRAQLVRTYVLSGLVAGLAGYLAMAQLGVATITAGQSDELSAIAAVVIGGASLSGGRGSIAGTAIGAAIIAVLETGLVIAKANSAWQLIVVGAILVGAVLADQQRVRAARSA